MKVAILDDEADSRGLIKKYLLDILPSADVVGEGDSIKDGIRLLSNVDVDLVFLDIQFPNGTGFDILSALNTVNFKIIFITAYDEYAINAIKHNALDYLLKPVNRTDFNLAMNKVINLSNAQNESRINGVLRTFKESGIGKLKLPTLNGFRFVDIDQIVRCESESNYTHFHLKDGNKVLVSKTMKEFEAKLEKHHFIRVHNSHIVNSKYIKEYIKGRGGDLIMEDGSRVSVSDAKKKGVLDFLG